MTEEDMSFNESCHVTFSDKCERPWRKDTAGKILVTQVVSFWFNGANSKKFGVKSSAPSPTTAFMAGERALVDPREQQNLDKW
jgi:hypothetical protein